jgi:hypothetical protein
MLEALKEYASARWAERTTWNGTWLLAIGGAIKYLAYATIAYGIWQVIQKET